MLNKIKVDKAVLLTKLVDNRALHGESFKAAMEGYKILVKKELEGLLARVEDGKELDRYLKNLPPEDHTADYDTAIEMLEWSTEASVELTQGEFLQYVKDDWGWKQGWEASNTQYITAASSR